MGILIELLGLLVAVIGGLVYLKRSGVDIGWLNPFAFFHRQAWKKKVNIPPVYTLAHPVDVAAVMGLAVVLTTGATTQQQKQGLVALYSKFFNASADEAEKLWIACSHLLKRRNLELNELPDVFERSKEKFSEFHIQAMISLMQAATELDNAKPQLQAQLIDATQKFFSLQKPNPQSWNT